MNHRGLKTLLVALLLLVAAFIVLLYQLAPKPSSTFDSQRAYRDVQVQVAFGPRLPGSEAHTRTIDWLTAELSRAGWQVETQNTTRMGHPIQNIVAKRSTGSPWIILSAHYDSRLIADNDPNPLNRFKPVPGANDGASGVAVLLEIARVLPVNLEKQIWLVFFDAEDQGNLPGWDWILGSRAFAASLASKPDAVIVIDMIGDINLNIYQEQSSTPLLNQSIWETAAQAGYQNAFIPLVKHKIIDDHVPFLELGIKAVDIIDIEYPYWHTTDDTPDKVSPKSLKIIGDTLIKWLEKPFPSP